MLIPPLFALSFASSPEITYEKQAENGVKEVNSTLSSPVPTPNFVLRASSKAEQEIKPPTEQDILCSCVRYAESLSPGIPLLNAIDYPLNTITPKVGDIIKLQYYNATTTRYTYHIAVIEKITEEGYSVKEANYERCQKGERTIPKTDDHILGFFNPARQRLIDDLTPIQRETLWNGSGWSMYDTKGAVLRGKDGEWGVARFMPGTWKWLSEKRRNEKLRMLDKMNFEHQIEMFKYGWSKGVTWYGTPDIVE